VPAAFFAVPDVVDFFAVEAFVPDFEPDDDFEGAFAGLLADFVPVDFVPVDFVAVDLEPVDFDAADVDRDFVVELDDFELLLLDRLRLGLSSPIGSALPTAFTAPPAAPPTAPPTVPAILPAVRPTCLTTFPGSGM
jgi:hypothetical protein